MDNSNFPSSSSPAPAGPHFNYTSIRTQLRLREMENRYRAEKAAGMHQYPSENEASAPKAKQADVAHLQPPPPEHLKAA